ncbi:MAG: diaminopropionate ammonia-lyase [Paracoccaceae bacterium]
MNDLVLPLLSSEKVNHFQNSASAGATWRSDIQGSVISAVGLADAKREIKGWGGYQSTPLISLSGLAAALGVKNILYKDEAPRFGLGSFKALGGAYAVYRLLARMVQAEDPPSSQDLKSGSYDAILKTTTISSATDGNHGRSVAWGAKQFNCRCVIYIHAGVSEGRKEALQALGAEVIRVAGNYDAAVRQCALDSETNGWFVVSDTSYEGYEEVPRNVMEGYSLIASEIIDQMNGEIPTHVFVQGGVGGVAAAICGTFWLNWGEQRPRFIVVEPELAACLFESARHGKLTNVDITDETLMAGLSCGEVSVIAWKVLQSGVSDFFTIPEDLVAPTMRLLARSAFGDPAIVAGESAVAGLAAFIASAQDGKLAESLSITAESVVLVIGTEGATDLKIYDTLVNGDVAPN